MDELEKELVKKAKAYDVNAFEELIKNYQKKVFNLVLRNLNNYDDAIEVTQEVFIRVFRSIKNFKEDSSFYTWVFRIASNLCIDELRKRKNENVVSINQTIELDDGEINIQIKDNSPTPSELFEKKELVKAVNASINQLDSQQKLIIILRDINGLSYEEIAKILDCPSGTVKSRLNRARYALKEILLKNKELLNEDYVK